MSFGEIILCVLTPVTAVHVVVSFAIGWRLGIRAAQLPRMFADDIREAQREQLRRAFPGLLVEDIPWWRYQLWLSADAGAANRCST
jgi:hypothetical protein